jgi:hypothetical protein
MAMSDALMFARAGRVLVVRRCETGEGPLLVLMGDDRDVRSYCFADQFGLAQFLSRLKQFLVDTGWSMVPLSVPPVTSGRTVPARPTSALRPLSA